MWSKIERFLTIYNAEQCRAMLKNVVVKGGPMYVNSRLGHTMALNED